jgi:hypothetical protein
MITRWHEQQSAGIFGREQFANQTSASLTKKYECSVKVFNSSVENFVEKALAKTKIIRDCMGLLLIAQDRCGRPGRH